MNMSGEQRIAAPRQKVWEALNDVAVLRASIPGCQALEKEADDRFAAIVEVKVGPIGARFKGAVTLTDLNPPHAYTLILQGNGGITGSVKGTAKVRLRDDADGTLVSFDVDAQIAGRMSQLGGPLIDATSKQLAGKFFSRFGEIVGGVNDATFLPQAQVLPTAHVSPRTERGAATAPQAPALVALAWILATVVAALTGFLIGRGQGGLGSDWSGLAIGLLLILVAGAAFEYGRRAASPTITIDSALLRKLLDGGKE